MLIVGEDASRDQFSAGCHFGEGVGSLIESSWDMVQLYPVELVFQFADLLIVRRHLVIVAVQFLHDLIDDESGVPFDFEVADP